MSIVLKRILSLLFILTAGKLLWAQSFVLKNYTTQDGLPSSETYSSIQDEKGFMWIATDRGLAKFDGYGFRTYTTEDGVPDNTIFEIFEDHKNRLWFKGFSTQLGYYKNDSFHIYKYNDRISTMSPSQLIKNFAVDKNDNIWFSKLHSKMIPLYKERMFLAKINPKGEVDSSYSFPKKLYNNDKKDTTRVYITDKGKAVVTGGLTTNSDYTEFFSLNDKKEIASLHHKPIYGDIIVAKLDEKHFVSVVGGMKIIFTNGYTKKIGECKSEVINLLVDSKKNIWIGYRGKGYECLLAKDNYTKLVEGLDGITVSSISQDREGGIWLTTLEKGVYYITPQRFMAYSKETELIDKKIIKIINIDQNILILNEKGEGLLKEKNKNTFEKILNKKLRQQSGVVYDGKENIYTFYPLLKRIKNKKNILLPEGHKEIFVAEKYVYAPIPGKILCYDRGGKIYKKLNFNKLPRVWSLFEKKDGSLLIGTLKGLFLYKNNKIIALKNRNPLFKYRVNDIKQFDKNHIIVATIGGGVLLFDERTPYRVKQYTKANGLPSLMCNTVWKENDTALWVGTNKGLCLISNVLDSNKAKFITISIGDGLASNEVNDLCKVGDDIWVATSSGISIINTFRYLKPLKSIPVYIKEVTINGKASHHTSKPEIDYKNNNISISFLGINYQYSNQLIYKYRLKNTENKWNYTKSRSVVYSSLPAGKYVFEVGVVKPRGEQNPLYAYYSFTILPPYWQTTWFIILVIICSLLLIAFFIKGRVSFVREQERLKHDLNTFRDKALRGQMNPHFIYNSLNAIQNYILKNDTKSSASFLSKFSQLMRLTFNNTAEELILLEKEIEGLELYAELENLRFNQKFSLHINTDNTIDRSVVKVPPLIMQPFVENAVLHGLLTKQGKGNIWVDIKPITHNNKKSLEITIKDDGIGLKNAEKIFDRKTRFRNPFSVKNNRKNSGIKTTQDRIQQIWGKGNTEHNFKIVDLQSENNLQTGTLILFYLPIYD
jgi:ligand-binding sensor domain-containing protein